MSTTLTAEWHVDEPQVRVTEATPAPRCAR